MKLKIRKYKKGDYEKFIHPLEKENMKFYMDKYISGGWSDKLNKLGFDENLKNGWIYLFGDDSEIFGNFRISPDNTDNTALYIHSIQIKQEFQNKGYGTQILNFIELKSKKLNFKKFRLSVFKDNPAINLYLKFDFEIIDSTPNLNLVLMEKILK